MSAKRETSLEALNRRISEASNEHYYIVISKGEVTTRRVHISGAETMWKNHPDYVYVPKYRFAGSKVDITEALESIGAPSSHTYAVGAEEDDDFKRELKLYNKYIKDTKIDNALSEVLFKEILSGIAHLRVHKKEADGTRHSYKKAAERYDSLEENETYLDVSDRHGEGKGSTVTKKIPSGRVQGPKNIRIVSNNVDTYRDELEAVGGFDAKDIDKACSIFETNLSRYKSEHKNDRKKTATIDLSAAKGKVAGVSTK